MSVTNPAELQPGEQAEALYTGVLGLPTDEAKLVGTFLDDRDLGVEINVPVEEFGGRVAGRVALTLVFEQTGYYREKLNLTEPSVITVGVPNSRNFDARNQPLGSLQFAKNGNITAALPTLARQSEVKGAIPIHYTAEQESAMRSLISQLIEASGAETQARKALLKS